MKVITCISYHGTGSGAVDDFFKEFNNCVSAATDIECRYLQDPDGISDLEYNLINNPHRLNSGYALKRYIKFAKNTSRTYKKIFGNKWDEYSEQYIDKLIRVRYYGNWHMDIHLLNYFQKYAYLFRRLISKIFKENPRKDYFPKMEYYHTNISEKEFLEITQSYNEKLCALLNPKGVEYVMLDQAIPTQNIDRYVRYFKNISVIAVDRDPRDLYINQMLLKDHVLPKDPLKFSIIYREMRERQEIEFKNQQNKILIKFEDLIYNYDETTEKIMSFIGQKKENHIRPKEIFIPENSMKNTKLWNKYPEYIEQVRIIEQELPEYLYDLKE